MKTSEKKISHSYTLDPDLIDWLSEIAPQFGHKSSGLLNFILRNIKSSGHYELPK